MTESGAEPVPRAESEAVPEPEPRPVPEPATRAEPVAESAARAEPVAAPATPASPARTFGRRWLHLVLGGALLMPFFLLTAVIVGIVAPGGGTFGGQIGRELVAYALALPLVLAAGFALPVRGLMDAAARGLLGPPYRDSPPADPAAPGARARTASWFLLHLALGGLVAGLCLALVPLAFVFVAKPVLPGSSRVATLPWVRDVPSGWAVPTGLALLLALFLFCRGAATLLARLAPTLLGPSPAEALALERARAARLARRYRLARDLHDSVGHSLSVVTLQAGAARRVLDQDPEFARSALAAIEDASREALSELDWMLGVLRDESDRPDPGGRPGQPAQLGQRNHPSDSASPNEPTGPSEPTRRTAPDLSAAASLVERTRAAGVPLDFALDGAPAADVPRPVSREAFRILQEALGNAVRHAGPGEVRARVRIDRAAAAVELEVVNPLPNRSTLLRRELDSRRRGGRGLTGVRERTQALGGRCTAGPDGDRWRLWARLPWSPTGDSGPSTGEEQA